MKALLIFLTLLLSADLFCQPTPPKTSKAYVAWSINPGQTKVSVEEASKYWAYLEEASKHYAEAGRRRSPGYLKKYLESALRVSGMVPGFPGRNRVDNALHFFCWGAIEGEFKPNYVGVNIPGTPTPSLGRGWGIKRFSLDFGWAGLNEANVAWTHKAARALRHGAPLPKEAKDHMHDSAEAWVTENVVVPAKMDLLRVDLSIARGARDHWKKTGDRELLDYRLYTQRFSEVGPDALDSMMLYRVLVEIDRKHRGWNYHTWHKELYQKLTR